MPTIRLARLVGVLLAVSTQLVLVARAEPGPATSAAHTATPETSQRARALPLVNTPWTGDFEQMLERRMIRVLVPYSRSLYFNDRGRERGVTADLVREFEQQLNRIHAARLAKRPITVVLIPTTRDRLLPGLVEGLGDIAAGNLTVTETRLDVADFHVLPHQPEIRELVVTSARAPAVETAEDLAGRRVHVRRSSSYYESLVALDQRLVAAGKPPAELLLVPDALEDEDMMEMVNAGLLETIVVDDWKARMWATVLPSIVVHEHAVLRSGARIGWAYRKGSTELAEAFRACDEAFGKQQASLGYRHAQYLKRIQQIRNNAGDAERRRFEALIELFRRHGAAYRFDPLMLAAQGFQESRLRQEVRSRVGAIGVMQLMPATGREMNVGNIVEVEPNVHAGAKYMDRLMTRYFGDASFDETNRTLFAFAAYNAGPRRIQQMRDEAAKRGLNPDEWFNNVEIVTGEKVGLETTTYVRNIYKYYAAYKLLTDAEAERRRARDALATGGGSAP